MAKRKTHHKRHIGKVRHHRRHISGVSAHDMSQDAITLVGLVAGTVVATAAQRQMTSFSPKIVSGLEIVAGIFVKGKYPSPFMQGLGYGIAGAGAIGIAHEFGVIQGVDSMCNQLFDRMIPGQYQEQPVQIQRVSGDMSDVSGIQNEDTMSGISNFDTLSGADSSLKAEYEEVQSLGM